MICVITFFLYIAGLLVKYYDWCLYPSGARDDNSNVTTVRVSEKFGLAMALQIAWTIQMKQQHTASPKGVALHSFNVLMAPV